MKYFIGNGGRLKTVNTEHKQEIINTLLHKFKSDFNGYRNVHGDFYLRGVVDALWEIDKQDMNIDSNTAVMGFNMAEQMAIKYMTDVFVSHLRDCNQDEYISSQGNVSAITLQKKLLQYTCE